MCGIGQGHQRRARRGQFADLGLAAAHDGLEGCPQGAFLQVAPRLRQLRLVELDLGLLHGELGLLLRQRLGGVEVLLRQLARAR
jgi:hypothetical protein